MSLSAFIRDHHEAIISEFAIFAKTLMPAGTDMTDAELRDHAEDILTAVVDDISTPQTSNEQSDKSQGHGSAKVMHASGKLHADDRIRHGFTLRSVVAEFRALRATVLRLYEESGASDLTDVRRFNEAIDEALTESIDRFAVQTDLFRDQFIGVLSHDLRTPLAAITVGAPLLAAPEDNPQRRSRVVARIVNSAKRMERMIGDLLDLTRARLGGSIPLNRRPPICSRCARRRSSRFEPASLTPSCALKPAGICAASGTPTASLRWCRIWSATRYSMAEERP